MALALDTIIRQLNDSGIIAPRKLANFIPPNAQPQDSEELLRELVEKSHLTRFQAQRVASGEAESLILGGYILLDKIGAGGMGQVFKAEHRRMKRIVAVKTLPASTMKEASAVARFQQEVEAAAKLRHPNIVAADDADEAHGVHFLVMEYIDGCNLSQLVKNHGRLSLQHAIGCTVQVARGMEYAHSQGIVHRDIKPSNLIIDKKGTVKVLDLGLARLTPVCSDGEQIDGLTATGDVMGTIDFMSPEQALETKDADQRADIYSLGCTLFFLLTGRMTYEGDKAIKRLLAHRNAPVPSISQVRSDVPETVDLIFRKMVAKRPEDRFQTMGDVLRALQSYSPNAESSLGETIQLILGGQGLAGGFHDLVANVTSGQEGRNPAAATNEKAANDTPLAVVGSTRTEKSRGRQLVTVASLLGALVLVGATLAVKYRSDDKKERGGEEASTLSRPAPIVKGPGLLTADQSGKERAVAEWVLRLGGKVHVTTATAMTVLEDPGQLPLEPLLVTVVSLNDNQQVTDNDLLQIGALSAITSLELGDTGISDAGLENLGALPSLRTLRLTRTKITDLGSMHFKRMENIQELFLNGTDISSASLQYFRWPSLKTLALNDTLVGDDGLGTLARLPGLEALNLSGTQISDAGIVQLKGCPVLFLTLRHVKIGRAGLAAMHDLPHLVELNLDETNVSDQDLEVLSSPRLKLIRLIGTKVTPVGIQALKTNLPSCTVITQ